MTERDKNKIKAKTENGDFITIDGITVCSICYGNCGQCGYTHLLGNIDPQTDKIVDHINKNSTKMKTSENKTNWFLIVMVIIIIINVVIFFY